MKKIKFKGKRVDNGDWWHGDLITECDVDLNIKKAYIHNKLSSIQFNGDCMSSFVVLIEVIPETIGQLTGLTDRKRVEIYEGDIVRLCGGEYCYGVWQYDSTEVVEDIRNLSCFDGCEEITIIGNIHDEKII